MYKIRRGVFLIRFALAWSALLLLGTPAEGQQLKVYYPAPERLHLTDSGGNPFNERQLDGQVWVANFFFTSCQGPCPLTMAQLAQLTRSLDGISDVRFLSISIDPERDTPARLTEYAAGIRQQDARWYVAVAELDHVTELIKDGFRVGQGGSVEAHSTTFVLVDAKRQIRGYYSGLRAEEMERLEKDIRSLLEHEPQRK
ncbi:MAG: SCO family protein [Bdellovibrionales bacterium]|nr:SCO family protein [Bdellovibrionales bacterium]